MRYQRLSKSRTPHGDRGGAVLLEMALVLPVLLGILMGIANLAWIYSIRQSMMFAVREGARELSLQGTTLNEARTLTTSYLTAANIHNAVVTGQNAFSGGGDSSAARRVYIQAELPANNAILSDPFNMFSGMGPIIIRVNMRKEGELLPP